MNAIRTILAASDFSISAAAAAHRAAFLAREHGAGLRLLHVVPEELLSEFRQILRESVYVEQQALAVARRRLEAMAEDLRSFTTMPPECSTGTGSVLYEILAAADHADLLVLGAHGLRSMSDLLIGTTAERLLRSCRRPMLVVRQEAKSPYRRVIVPVDFSVHSYAALRFALQIAPSAELLLFHAYESPYENDFSRAGVPDEKVAHFQVEQRDQMLTNLERLRDRTAAPGVRIALSVERGHAKVAIAAKAAELDSDLIVVGKHGRSFVGELFVGGVTRHTLARACCDVAVVPEYPRL